MLLVVLLKTKSLKDLFQLLFQLTKKQQAYGCPAIMKYLRKRGEKIDFSVVGEPSSNKSVGDEIRIGRRGSMNGIVTLYGKSGHSAFAGSYINPCTALAKNNIKIKKFTFR